MADEQSLAEVQVVLILEIIPLVVNAVCRLVGIGDVCDELDRAYGVLLVFSRFGAPVVLLAFHSHLHVHLCGVACCVGTESDVVLGEFVVTMIAQIGGNSVSFSIQSCHFEW